MKKLLLFILVSPVFAQVTQTNYVTYDPSIGFVVQVGLLAKDLPSGLITIVTGTGLTCPTGFDEMTAMNGKTVIGTINANNDVGTTGGSDTIQPTISASSTFTGTTNQSTSSVSAGTPSGTNSTPTFTGTLQNFSSVNNISLLGLGSALSSPTSITPQGTVSAPTFTGSTLGTHSHTVTPAGTVSTSASNSVVDNRSQFVKVIFCSKS